MYELGILKRVLIPSQNISSLQSTTWTNIHAPTKVRSTAIERGASEVYCRAVVEIYDVQNVLLLYSCYFGIWYGFKVVLGTRSLNRKTYTTSHHVTAIPLSLQNRMGFWWTWKTSIISGFRTRTLQHICFLSVTCEPPVAADCCDICPSYDEHLCTYRRYHASATRQHNSPRDTN
jgi:hypothetical protein